MDVSRSEKIKEIIHEMFEQRGYKDIHLTDENYIIATRPDKKIVVAFGTIVVKLNVSEIHTHISILQKMDVNHGLIVYEGIPTSAVKNVVTNAPDIGINIELFVADDLQFNITKHELVPKHVLLRKSKAKKFREIYGTNIPVLLKNDAIARFYDFHRGDIIKVIRRNGMVSFRIVR